MSQIERFREQIDACRPGSDDLSLPALAELAQAAEQDRALAAELARSQQFDRAVAAAMHDIAAPPGMLDRLLASISTAETAEEVSLPCVEGNVARSPAYLSRRRWLALGGSIALLALLSLSGAYLWLQPGRIISQSELVGTIQGWQAVLAERPDRWQAVTSNQVPWGYPIDRAILGTPTKWQTIRSWSSSVSAIDLAQAGGQEATLLIVRSSAKYDGIPPVPSSGYRLPVSGGFAVTAWQKVDSNVLYVLIVKEAPGQQLEQFLQPSFQA